MASGTKKKINSNIKLEEKSNGSSLLSSKKRNRKIEDVLASIITILTDMFDSIFTCNVKWVQMSLYNGI